MRISHADVDFLGEVKVSALLGQLEQTAVEASAEAGYDPARYTAEGRVWLVRRTHLERLEPVGGGDSLSVTTRVEDFRRARSLRSYDMSRTGGFDQPSETLVGTARTDWVYCDVATGRPASVPQEMQSALFGPTGAPRAARLPRVSLPDAPPHGSMRFEVRASHLDHMGHVNNAVWADFLEDAALSLLDHPDRPLARMLEEGAALRIRTLDLEYLGDARLGQALEVRSWLLDGGPLADGAHLAQEVRGPGESRLLLAESHWSWRRRAAILGARPVVSTSVG